MIYKPQCVTNCRYKCPKTLFCTNRFFGEKNMCLFYRDNQGQPGIVLYSAPYSPAGMWHVGEYSAG